MKRNPIKHFIFVLSLVLISISFTKCEKPTECDGTNGTKVGAMCNDGTKSNSAGSGTCTSRGGVNYWLYK